VKCTKIICAKDAAMYPCFLAPAVGHDFEPDTCARILMEDLVLCSEHADALDPVDFFDRPGAGEGFAEAFRSVGGAPPDLSRARVEWIMI
jgi:hypothetical protein